MAAYDMLAVATDNAKARIAQMLENGKSYKISRFALGDRGALATDPTIVITPDPTITDYVYGNTLNHAALPLPSGAAIAGVTRATLTCPVFSCVLPAGGYIGNVSAIYLLGEIVYSPDPSDPELGNFFIAAVATRPQTPFGPVDTLNFDVGIVL